MPLKAVREALVLCVSQPVFIKEPDKFDLPYSGLLTFDYITYKFGTVLEGAKAQLPGFCRWLKR